MGLLLNENEFTSKSTSPKLIGETFTTLRTGIIDGAVEQDGSQYNFSDYPEIETLLKNGDLPYINIGNFDEMVSNQGGCDSFGYGPGKFYGWEKTMYGGPFYTRSETPKINDYLYTKENNLMVYHRPVCGFSETYGVQIDGDGHYAGRESSLDEIDNTPTTYFKVPKKASRVLVRSQKYSPSYYPTYFNLYADGWVEQGGEVSIGSGVKTITFPIKMANSIYLSIVSTVSEQEAGIKVQQKNTTGFQINKPNSRCEWKVEGYADPTEYTKDKWNYQNVNYERHMIQLK